MMYSLEKIMECVVSENFENRTAYTPAAAAVTLLLSLLAETANIIYIDSSSTTVARLRGEGIA